MTKFQDLKLGFLKIDQADDHEGLGGESCAKWESFRQLSPGVRLFPEKPAKRSK